MKYLLPLIIGILATSVFAYLMFFSNSEEELSDEENIETPLPTLEPVDKPDGWNTYQNEELGISFAVPENVEVQQNGDYSVLAVPQNDIPRASDPRFFYVSVVPENKKTDTSGEIYNYQYPFHQQLLSIPVGERDFLNDTDELRDWYMYERAGDDVFNGKTAKVYVNQRPWEFPGGTWEYRYIFEMPNKTVIAGAYIEGGPTDAQFSLPLLTQIMNTLSISE